MTDAPYNVEVAPRRCIDCGRPAHFRVVDTRKKHDDRYPEPLRCSWCAKHWADQLNSDVAASQKVNGS